jgi:hypothetical protein
VRTRNPLRPDTWAPREARTHPRPAKRESHGQHSQTPIRRLQSGLVEELDKLHVRTLTDHGRHIRSATSKDSGSTRRGAIPRTSTRSTPSSPRAIYSPVSLVPRTVRDPRSPRRRTVSDGRSRENIRRAVLDLLAAGTAGQPDCVQVPLVEVTYSMVSEDEAASVVRPVVAANRRAAERTRE